MTKDTSVTTSHHNYTNYTMMEIEMPIYPVLIILGLLFGYMYLLYIYKEELTQLGGGSLHETGVNYNNAIRPPPIPPQVETQAEQERQQEERYFHILTNVVHKKAVAKIDDKEERIKLPHEEEISHRSLQQEYDEEAQPELKHTQELYKTDITISSSSRRLCSWRRQQSTISMTNILERMAGVSDRESSIGSLYSPKTCPICLEKYKAGDDICWSKNVNCAHAYHLECMTEWLMNNDDCPLCRGKYLVEDEQSNDNM